MDNEIVLSDSDNECANDLFPVRKRARHIQSTHSKVKRIWLVSVDGADKESRLLVDCRRELKNRCAGKKRFLHSAVIIGLIGIVWQTSVGYNGTVSLVHRIASSGGNVAQKCLNYLIVEATWLTAPIPFAEPNWREATEDTH